MLEVILVGIYNYPKSQVPFLTEEFQAGNAWIDSDLRLVRRCEVMPFDCNGCHATGIEVWDEFFQAWYDEFDEIEW